MGKKEKRNYVSFPDLARRHGLFGSKPKCQGCDSISGLFDSVSFLLTKKIFFWEVLCLF